MYFMLLKKKKREMYFFFLYICYFCEILFNVDNIFLERCNFLVVIFFCKCVIEDVFGISKIFGECCNSYVSVICIGVVFRFVVILESVDDCSGVKFLSGKNGM